MALHVCKHLHGSAADSPMCVRPRRTSPAAPANTFRGFSLDTCCCGRDVKTPARSKISRKQSRVWRWLSPQQMIYVRSQAPAFASSPLPPLFLPCQSALGLLLWSWGGARRWLWLEWRGSSSTLRTTTKKEGEEEEEAAESRCHLVTGGHAARERWWGGGGLLVVGTLPKKGVYVYVYMCMCACVCAAWWWIIVLLP